MEVDNQRLARYTSFNHRNYNKILMIGHKEISGD